MEEARLARAHERQPISRLFLLYWLPVLLYLAVIFALSAQPHLQVPFKFQNSDKFCHILEYGGLGWLVVRALSATRGTPPGPAIALLTLAIGVAIGASDEFFQSFVPGRDSSVFDALADTAGVILAEIAYFALSRD